MIMMVMTHLTDEASAEQADCLVCCQDVSARDGIGEGEDGLSQLPALHQALLERQEEGAAGGRQ
jgi:hypothetical protein